MMSEPSKVEIAREKFHDAIKDLKGVTNPDEIKRIRKDIDVKREAFWNEVRILRTQKQSRTKDVTEGFVRPPKLGTEKTIEKIELICPICHDLDRGNILNDKPACIKCMHDLVPKDELKKYNRAYRRRWKLRRKK